MLDDILDAMEQVVLVTSQICIGFTPTA